MKLADFCIKRPVFATVLNLLIVLAGIVAYQNLTIREFPKVDKPVVSVTTYYMGASAELIERQITRPLEDALSGLEGVDTMDSSSTDEQSQITLTFLPSRDIEAATNDVRDRIGRAKNILPQDAEEPTIQKADADADAIMWLSVSSKQYSLMEISEFVDSILKDKLEIIPGVARLYVVGNRIPAMRIWLDTVKLSAYNLSVQDVFQALLSQNAEIPSGRIESEDVEFTVFSKTDLQSIEQFNNIIVKQEDGQLVRLKEVAKVNIEPASERFLARYNQNETVALGIIKQSTANPLEIAHAVDALLPQLAANMPKGMHIEIAYDSTLTIKNSIESVFKTLFEAAILVIFVIFVFLRSMRATLIPLVTIPISLISAFAIMAAFNFSINTLTLLAMVLAIGLVVDDAIVVLENIHRHVESGLSPLESARKGMKEIGFAVIAMTLTLLAVFTPIAFSQGYVGKLFAEFAIVLSGSVVVSGITALTLSPMMCSRLLKHEDSHGRIYLWIERFLEGLNALYARTLKVALNHTFWVLGLFFVVLALNYFLFMGLKSELTPAEDRGFIIAVGVAPQGSSVNYTNKYAKQMEQVLADNANIQRFFTIIGYPYVTQTMSFAMLPPHEKRDVSQFDVTEQLNKNFWGISGLASFAINPPSSIEGHGSSDDVAFVIQSPKGFEELAKFSEIILNKARQNPKLLNLGIDFKVNKPQIELHVDRERAAMLGIDLSMIGQTLQVLYGGKKASTYSQGSQQYDVLVQADMAARQTPESIHSVYVRSQNNTMIPLASLVEPKETVAANSLNRFNKLPAAIISASLTPDYTLQEALRYFESITKEVNSEFLIDYAGASRTFKQSVNTLAQAFILALLVIFLVLAAQFESFKSPFIIMLSVPCAIFGALLILYLTAGSLNIFSQIGLITLIGLITKHGILLVEFTQQLRQEGLSLQESLLESARLRFRPILMTTAATVLGAFPLALATGAGAEGRNQIGWVIVGGMLIGTLFTLFIVPAIYKIITKETAVTNADRQGDLV